MKIYKKLPKSFSIAVFLSTLAGCGLTPEQITTASTQKLCNAIASPASPDFDNEEIHTELKKRNAESCATKSILDANLADYKKRKAAEAQLHQGNDGGDDSGSAESSGSGGY